MDASKGKEEMEWDGKSCIIRVMFTSPVDQVDRDHLGQCLRYTDGRGNRRDIKAQRTRFFNWLP